MKRLFTVLLLAACAAALAAGPAAAGVSSRAEVVPGPPENISPPTAPEGRTNINFNTGGEMFKPPTLYGSASWWSYYILHEYSFQGDWWFVNSFGFPTNEYSSDPIAMPVEWVADCEVGDIYAISNPYSYDWTWRGTFYPAGNPDTLPPDTYTVLNPWIVITGQNQMMVWGYENAGLCGQIEYNGVETIGWYMGFWDSDVPYGRTSLMQFTAANCTPTEERSLSAIKSLY